MNIDNLLAESASTSVAVQPTAATLATLAAWDAMAEKAYSANTRRAQRADGAIFQHFCEGRRLSFLPADPMTVRAFIEARAIEGRKPATIRRSIATIARAHQAACLLNPCDSEPVRLALRELGRTTVARQRQALALGWNEIKAFLECAGDSLRAHRERALLCVAYDTMARRSELVALDLNDVSFHPNGSGTVLVQRSKTDQAGEGATAYLSRTTVMYLNTWLIKAGIALEENEMKNEGRGSPIFRRVRSNGLIGEQLHADIISDIYKRVAAYIGMPAKKVSQVSGHSIRVGATQDLLALNIDLASVMQAGRWKSTVMPMRYGEEVLAARGGMSRAAEAQGRELTNQADKL